MPTVGEDHERQRAAAEQRGKMIKLHEDALMLADDLEDGHTGYLFRACTRRGAVTAVHSGTRIHPTPIRSRRAGSMNR